MLRDVSASLPHIEIESQIFTTAPYRTAISCSSSRVKSSISRTFPSRRST